MDRHRQAVMMINASDGNLCMVPGTGTQPGDAAAATLFWAFLNPVLKRWLQRVRQGDSTLSDITDWQGIERDVSSGAYADDIARVLLSRVAATLARRLVNEDKILVEELEPTKVSQNLTKKEYLVNIRGKGPGDGPNCWKAMQCQVLQSLS